MTQTNATEIMPHPEVQSPSDERDLMIAEKFRTAFGITVSRGGAVYETADLLYDAMYNPTEAVERHGISASEQFPNRIPTLESQLPDAENHASPEREAFVELARDALTREVDHQACMYPGSKDAVRAMAQAGPTVIWTQGDMLGRPDEGVPGSYEQIKKIAGGGIAEVRREVALAKVAIADEPTARVINRTLTVASAEDKFAPEVIDHMVGYFEAAGVNKVVVLEDRLKNLVRLQAVLREKGIEAEGIWVRQGRHAENEEQLPEGIVSVDNIAEVTGLVVGYGEGTGFVSDFDGVLSNQKLRVKLQIKALQDSLKRHNY